MHIKPLRFTSPLFLLTLFLTVACTDTPEPYPIEVLDARLDVDQDTGEATLWMKVRNKSDRGVDAWSLRYTPRDDFDNPLARRVAISDNGAVHNVEDRLYSSNQDILPGQVIEVSIPFTEEPDATRVEVDWGRARHERTDDDIYCNMDGPPCFLRLRSEPW